jgi:F-type H+-transporting ATPase subunit gamma
MPERLADIVTQIQNVRQLGTVVAAIRGMAASQAQKGRSLLDGIDAYSKVISHAIGLALSLLPPDVATAPPLRRASTGLILFCAEQGFAGAYSERVLDAAAGSSRASGE